ncbi:MAG: hypothetical protein Q4F72_11760, partial [Desulfovibrionaceae bacterium]|nr:hypothetical protein [Desulfovibrionaceae bacterium]
YLNLYDSNDGEYEAEIRKELEREDSFARFLQDFPDYAETCSRTQNRRLAQAVEQFVKEHYPDDWTVRLKKDSASFLKTWPHRKGTTQAQDITAFVRGLGITVGTASRISDREEVFELQVEPADRNLADYPHPFAAFGTQLGTPLYVVVMYGMHLPRNLPGEVNALKRLSRTGMNIVLLDHTLTLEQRRQLAEACHQKSDSTRFIVIDRILALYLAMCSQAERLSTLLNCALPFAAALQPFVRDGGMTPEEMFVGRTRELADIINFNGATLVYGGRQLGKTALLYRARSRCHVPANRDFAIVCSIKGLGDEALAAQAFADAVNKESKLAIRDCSTVKAFCDQIEKRFADGRIQSLRLMIDEADAFLNGIAEQDYAPVGALIALMRSCPRFKFVLAGLNNVYRARRATGNNGDFGQLGQPLCITPLSPAIALGFILRPLRYLGFQPAQDAQLATILSSTNYYPGILHFFGYIIVQSLNEKYGLYYKAAEGNPPFILKKELLGSIMNSSELNSSICDKFRLSLKLDERYYMLARCLGIIYHMGEPMLDGYKGYSVDTIKRMAEYYGIHCLVRLNRSEYMALLDEMTEMGILHRAEEGVYRLRKRSFLDIIGSDMDRLEAEIIDENTAEAEA